MARGGGRMFVCAENQLMEDEIKNLHIQIKKVKLDIATLIQSEPEESKTTLKKVIAKLLTVSDFCLVSAGGSTDKNGIINNHYIESSRLKRIQWVVSFLFQLRQSQVVLQWHKYNCHIKKWQEWVQPDYDFKAEDTPTPYWAFTYINSNWEPDDLLTLEKILWTLNWYEERAKESEKVDRVMVGFAEMFKHY